MGAPGGGLKQCAQGRGQDRTSVGSPHMPKATFPFVTARQWVDGWRLFFYAFSLRLDSDWDSSRLRISSIAIYDCGTK